MKGLKVLLVLGCTAVRAGLLRSVGHGQQDLEDELIHWATGGWHDWDSYHGVLQQEGGEAPESIDQRLKEEPEGDGACGCDVWQPDVLDRV